MDNWQTPRELFSSLEQKQKVGEEKSRELYCYNPQCLRQITDGMVGHNPTDREIYCSDQCVMMATALRCFRTAEPSVASIDWITISQAMKLKREGQLH